MPKKGRFLHHSYILMLKDFKFFVNEVRQKEQVFCVQNTILLGFLGEWMDMKMIKIRFLEKREEAELPKWAKFLPKKGRKWYIEKRRPYCIRMEKEGLTAVLQTTSENSMTAPWRKNGRKLLEQLKKEGAAIIIPPLEGELPRDVLPFAEGKQLMTLFAFLGAEEVLKRQGKNPEECTYLLAGGNEEIWRSALVSMGNEVNHLAIFTADVKGAEKLEQELFEERGLLTEVFASPKNPVLSQADVVFCCGMEQRKYEHMLKNDAVWIDLAGNRPVLRRLAERRQDVTVADGFFFARENRQMDGRWAEAEIFCSCESFRDCWKFSPAETKGKEILCELKERGYAVSGFSFMGNRVKIQKKP